jgi:hypothetical protein
MGQLALDGLHPVQAANDRMAKYIVELMAIRKMRR